MRFEVSHSVTADTHTTIEPTDNMDDDSSGDETAYVKLISAEGSEIFLPRRIAVQVEMMKAMLEGGYQVGGPFCFPRLH